MNYDEFMRLYQANHSYTPANYGSTDTDYAGKFLSAYNAVKSARQESKAEDEVELEKRKAAATSAGESAQAAYEGTAKASEKAQQDKNTNQAAGEAIRSINNKRKAATWEKPELYNETSSKGIKSTGDEALDVVANAPGYSYEYKNPERHGYGRFVGPMAQHLASTPGGQSVVEQTPDGLAVNTGRLTLVNTAAAHAMQNEIESQQSEMEKLRRELEALRNSRRG